MNRQEKSLVLAKRIECILGILLLLPPFLSIFSLLLCWYGEGGDLIGFYNLHGIWGFRNGDYGFSSTTPIYLGLLAIAGVYLIKDSLKYFFIKKDDGI